MKTVLGLALALITSTSFANELRYTYVEGGFIFASESNSRTEYIDNGTSQPYQYSFDVDTTATLGYGKGSVGFGPVFYLPASIESSIKEYDVESCFDGVCGNYDLRVSEVLLTVGAGLHADVGERVSLYADASFLQSSLSVDDDGGYDDFDDRETESGNQTRAGIRFATGSLLEFDINLMRRHYADYTTRIQSIAAQFNITPTIGIGAQWRKEKVEGDDWGWDNLSYLGAYFRYSFK